MSTSPRIANEGQHLADAVIDLLRRRGPELPEAVTQRIADVLLHQVDGDTCIEVPDGAVPEVPGLIARLTDGDFAANPDAVEALVGKAPFVSCGDRFYTQRQFLDELSVARSIGRLLAQRDDLRPLVPSERLEALLRSPLKPEYEIPLQIGRRVLATNFNVLVGGPGTGKTYNLTRYLVLVIEALLARGVEPRIAVGAPTGKAATRAAEMLETFVRSEPTLSDDVRRVLRSIVPTTVHRILGSKPGSRLRFRHDAATPLALDLLVVDEMSMVPLPLAARLFEAVPDGCRVLLVGDEAQLESIEVGAVLSQFTSATAPQRVRERVGTLTVTFRQSDDSVINEAAGALRMQDSASFFELISREGTDTEWVQPTNVAAADPAVVERVAALLAPAVEQAQSLDPVQHLEALDTFAGVKVLCGPREGALGVRGWNDAIARSLGVATNGAPAVGTPLLITVNSPAQQLVNGSVGVVVATERGVRVAFPHVVDAVAAEEGDEGADGVPAPPKRSVRHLTLAELPPHEPCFAMTVHKSQGSEYDQLVVMVVPHHESQLLCRELVYTGITRAKRKLVIVGSKQSLDVALAKATTRVSGLSAMLDLLLA